ncbi:MAG: hypothetical protein JWQ35_800 [Bacteriovoracaceae bacterium]|nr:hypothetical protein [Bacteriovoracaceae bacterium]
MKTSLAILALFIFSVVQAAENKIPTSKIQESVIFYLRTALNGESRDAAEKRKDFPVRVLYDNTGLKELLIPQIEEVKNPVITHVNLEQLRKGAPVKDGNTVVLIVTGSNFDPQLGGQIELKYLKKLLFFSHENEMGTVHFSVHRSLDDGKKVWKCFQSKDKEKETEFNVATLFMPSIRLRLTGYIGISRILFSEGEPKK